MTDPKLYRRLLRRRLTWIVLAAGMVVVVVGALVFEPWKLFVDQRVEEAPPAAAAAPVGGAPADQVVLARGQLISHEHESSGSVVVYRLADGSRVLRVEGLGPATARPCTSGSPTPRSSRAARVGTSSTTGATSTSASSRATSAARTT